MRSVSTAVSRTPASPLASPLVIANRPVRKPECLAVMDPEFFPMLFGAEERAALERLGNFSRGRIAAEGLTCPGAHFAEVEAIIGGWGMPVLDEAMLARFPRLRMVFYAAGTVRGIVTAASWRRGIRVTTAALANAKPVAEFTQAAIVFALKRVWERARALREFNRYLRHTPRLPGCYGTTVGLLALGKVGRLVAQRLRDMEVRVIAFDPYVPPSDAARLGVRLCGIEEVFATADAVSCHLPLHAGTTGRLDATLFRRMKRDATFINTARGGVVNEPELVAVLRDRPDLYAVLDTIAEEPPSPDNPLLHLPNVVVTPHIAGSMCDECRRLGIMMVDELRRYVEGAPLLGEVREDELQRLA